MRELSSACRVPEDIDLFKTFEATRPVLEAKRSGRVYDEKGNR